jgi:hypothetical protein
MGSGVTRAETDTRVGAGVRGRAAAAGGRHPERRGHRRGGRTADRHG